MRSLNGLGSVESITKRYDSTLLAIVVWDGAISGAGGPGGGSTQVSVSTGNVQTLPQSTVWAGNAGFHFDGSGNLNIAGSFSASTTVNVSSLAGVVSVAQNSTVWQVQLSQYSTTAQVSSVGGVVAVAQNSTVWAVQLTQYSTVAQVSSVAGRVATAPFSTAWASSAGFHFDGSGNLLTAGGAGGSSQVTISRVQDGADVGVFVGDSTNNAIRVNVVAGAAGGSTIVTVSTGSVRVHQSTAADLQATVTPASTVWAVQLSNYSTTVQVSSLGGTVSVVQASTGTWSVLARNSDNLGNLIESSTNAGSGTNSTRRGMVVRQAIPDCTSATAQAGSSGDITVFSSAANTIYVYAYSLNYRGSTVAGQVNARFLSGSTAPLWRCVMGFVGQSTGNLSFAAADQLAVTPPAYLFKTAASAPLLLNITSSGVNYSVAAFRE